MNKPRPKKCKTCKKLFKPLNMGHINCSYKCAINYTKHRNELRAKKAKQEINKKKKELNQNDKSYMTKKAQENFNKYIKLRDDTKPCVSCGHLEGRQFHAGHYQSTGRKKQLRFNLWNVHKQCSICNNYLSGNLIEYRKELIKRIGLKKVEWLECNNEVKKYSIEYLHRVNNIFKKKIKRRLHGLNKQILQDK